jgi:phosphatidylglycerophosphatase A
LTILADQLPQPTLQFVYRHPAHFIAFGGGIGLIPFAPGTFGTLLAIPLFHLLQPLLAPWIFLLVIVALFWLGVWACAVAGRALGAADHGGMVWDEVVAFLLVLFFVPAGGYWLAFAFVVFRFFDIFKPPPIRYYDRTLKNGFGVMWDDLIAAAYALLVLAAAYALMA